MITNHNFSFVIADDDQEDQILLLEAFSQTKHNYESVSVFNGVQLMDYLQHRNKYAGVGHTNPDFIFLDLNMPEKNGFETLRELKADTNLQNIPVYIFSTTCSSKDCDTLLEIGAEKCFTKPIAFADYKKIIGEIISD